MTIDVTYQTVDHRFELEIRSLSGETHSFFDDNPDLIHEVKAAVETALYEYLRRKKRLSSEK